MYIISRRHTIPSTLLSQQVLSAAAARLWILSMNHNCLTSSIWEKGPSYRSNENVSSLSTTQQAHNLKITSYQRRCDAMTSHRRRYDGVLTPCACSTSDTFAPIHLPQIRPDKTSGLIWSQTVLHWWYSWKSFSKKLILNKPADDKKTWKITQ